MHGDRRPRSRHFITITLGVVLGLTLLPTAVAGARPTPVRFATFNASLNRNAPGQALTDLSSVGNAQASAIAEIIQRVRPEVLLINEFDYEPDNALAEAFQANYLSIPQHGDVDAIAYPLEIGSAPRGISLAGCRSGRAGAGR